MARSTERRTDGSASSRSPSPSSKPVRASAYRPACCAAAAFSSATLALALPAGSIDLPALAASLGVPARPRGPGRLPRAPPGPWLGRGAPSPSPPPGLGLGGGLQGGHRLQAD